MQAPRRPALREGVRHARLQGLSRREIAREPGTACNTVRRHARALAPPAARPSRRAQRTGTGISDPIRRLTFALDNDAILRWRTVGGARCGKDEAYRQIQKEQEETQHLFAVVKRPGSSPDRIHRPPVEGGPPSGQQQLGEVCSEVGICKGNGTENIDRSSDTPAGYRPLNRGGPGWRRNISLPQPI